MRTGAAALADLPDGATVFIDGFGGPGGMAHYLLTALRDSGRRGADYRQQHGGHCAGGELRHAAGPDGH